MTSSSEMARNLCLHEELQTSLELLKSGFGHLQEIDMGRTFYHLPHQLMASGFERLMKCYISLVYKGRHGSFPDVSTRKSLGHNLVSLLNKIRTDWYGGTHRPLLEQDLEFITNDKIVNECIRILSHFGQKGHSNSQDVASGKPCTVHSPTTTIPWTGPEPAWRVP